MKDIIKNCTLFTVNGSNAAANKITPGLSVLCGNKTNHSYLTAVILAIILFLCVSCDRNIASGCGTWPMVSSKNDKTHNGMYRSDARPVYYKNNRQYTYYKKYN
ncbi:MAG: hypothetical protein IPM95_02735 [Sphingobacteriales bacterium]|nr:hypothetical protein [Sphingobacteriales bacterium]